VLLPKPQERLPGPVQQFSEPAKFQLNTPLNSESLLVVLYHQAQAITGVPPRRESLIMLQTKLILLMTELKLDKTLEEDMLITTRDHYH